MAGGSVKSYNHEKVVKGVWLFLMRLTLRSSNSTLSNQPQKTKTYMQKTSCRSLVSSRKREVRSSWGNRWLGTHSGRWGDGRKWNQVGTEVPSSWCVLSCHTVPSLQSTSSNIKLLWIKRQWPQTIKLSMVSMWAQGPELLSCVTMKLPCSFRDSQETRMTSRDLLCTVHAP